VPGVGVERRIERSAVSIFEEPARDDESPPSEEPREAEEPETLPEEADLAPENDEREQRI
jgi:hypothetical protein